MIVSLSKYSMVARYKIHLCKESYVSFLRGIFSAFWKFQLFLERSAQVFRQFVTISVASR